MSLTIMDVYLRSLLFLETVTMTTEYQSSRPQPTTGPLDDGLQLSTTGSGNDSRRSQPTTGPCDDFKPCTTGSGNQKDDGN